MDYDRTVSAVGTFAPLRINEVYARISSTPEITENDIASTALGYQTPQEALKEENLVAWQRRGIDAAKDYVVVTLLPNRTPHIDEGLFEFFQDSTTRNDPALLETVILGQQ